MIIVLFNGPIAGLFASFLIVVASVPGCLEGATSCETASPVTWALWNLLGPDGSYLIAG